VIQDDVFARLLTFPNVLITGHQGFFTREALANIAETTLANATAFETARGELHEVILEEVGGAARRAADPRHPRPDARRPLVRGARRVAGVASRWGSPSWSSGSPPRGAGARPPAALAGTTAEAGFTALTILWIIGPALGIHQLQLRTGAADVLRAALGAFAPDPRILALLVAWFFVLFMEGAAGFGASVALAAPFLVAAGSGRWRRSPSR
jgi:hypothetical protein